MACCLCCGPWCGVPVKLAAWIYFALFLIVTVVSWVLRDYGGDALDFGPADGCNESEVCGAFAVLRLSFGTAIFFVIMGLLTLGVDSEESPRISFHSGCWPAKVLIWGGIVGSTFAMPNGVFEVWQQMARVFAAIFILFQLIILLEFIYSINEYLLERDDWISRTALIFLSFLLIVGSIVGLGFLYAFWAPKASCSLNIFFITFALILFLLYGSISVSPLRVESAGLLTTAAVFAYCTYYTWSALQSEPTSSCTPDGSGGGSALRIIAFVLAVVAMSITTINSGRSSAAFSLVDDPEQGDSENESKALPYRPDFFYLIFFLASSYMAMVLVGWDIMNGDNGEFTLDKGWFSVWVKIVASWICAGLYTWSLIAHRILTDRIF